MTIIRSLALIALAGLSAPRVARADTITWRQLSSSLPGATQLVACAKKIYYVDNDRWLWGGTIPSGSKPPVWQRLSSVSLSVVALSCAAGRLYMVNSDLRLYRNDGDDLHPRWQMVGTSPSQQVVAATLGSRAMFYGLSSRGALLMSQSGSTWRELGNPPAGVQRIVAPSERDIFALDTNGRLYVNHGTGHNGYWRDLERPPGGAREIASADARILFGLAQDGSLWEGTITRVVRSLQIGSEINPWLTSALNFSRIDIRQVCLPAVAGNPRLLAEGRIPRPGGQACTLHVQVSFDPILLQQLDVKLLPVDITIAALPWQLPKGTLLGLSDFSSRDRRPFSVSLARDRMEVSAAFGDTRVIFDPGVGPLGFDVSGISLAGDMVPDGNPWGVRAFSLTNFQFNGELHGTDLPSGFVTLFVDFKAKMQHELGPRFAEYFASEAVQAAVRQVLVQYANFITHEPWQNLAYYPGVSIADGVLRVSVDR
jgi:hypothetical protein